MFSTNDIEVSMPLERLFVYVFKFPFHTIVYMLTLSNTWDSNRNLNVIMEPLNFVNTFCQGPGQIYDH